LVRIKCPECGSTRLFKDGKRRTKQGKVQRFLCRDCGYRFTDPQNIRRYNGISYNAGSNPAYKLKEAEKETAEVGMREATVDTKSVLFNFAWWMKKQGYAESTIKSRVKLLKIMARRGADLHNPESVKEVIAKQKWSLGRKENAVIAYSSFLKMTGGSWDPPRHKRVEKLPWVPLENEIDQLIAGCSRRVATFLRLLKETGMRPGEAWQLRWIDIDFEKNTVTVTPEKKSKPRIFKMSSSLEAMLKALPQDSEHVFKSGHFKSFAQNFRKQRRRVAAKLKNPRINRITFKTLRHFKATMEYARTKDLLHVMNILGHKNIKNTLIYTHLVKFSSDEYVCKVAKTLDDAMALVEAGFEYVTDMDGAKLFRKHK